MPFCGMISLVEESPAQRNNLTCHLYRILGMCGIRVCFAVGCGGEEQIHHMRC